MPGVFAHYSFQENLPLTRNSTCHTTLSGSGVMSGPTWRCSVSLTAVGVCLLGGGLGFFQRLLPSGAAPQFPHLDEVLPSPFCEKSETSLPGPFSQAAFAFFCSELLHLAFSAPMILGGHARVGKLLWLRGPLWGGEGRASITCLHNLLGKLPFIW